MNNHHKYASAEEHMQAMEAKLEAILKAEEDACLNQVSVTAEDIASF